MMHSTLCWRAAPSTPDGEGTILATEACLLSRGRNPELSRAEIEQELKNYLGAQKIVWLPRGIYNDETNEHVDNVCAYVGPAEVVLAWTEDENDPQYALSRASLDALEAATDAKGRHFTVHKLPIPAKPICVTEEELQGYAFEEGEDTREAGGAPCSKLCELLHLQRRHHPAAVRGRERRRGGTHSGRTVPGPQGVPHPGPEHSGGRRQHPLRHPADPQRLTETI